MVEKESDKDDKLSAFSDYSSVLGRTLVKAKVKVKVNLKMNVRLTHSYQLLQQWCMHKSEVERNIAIVVFTRQRLPTWLNTIRSRRHKQCRY